MAYEVLMPQLGLTMEEGTVSQWIKHEGDEVKTGDVIVEITTDKLTNEVASEHDGVLLKIVAQEGEDIPVKGLLAYIGQPGEAVGDAPAAPAAAPAAEAAPAAVAAPAAAPAPAKKEAPKAGLELMEGDTVVKLTGMRKVVAERMLASHTEIPPVTQNIKVDVTELMKFRKMLLAETGKKYSVNDLVLKAIAKCLTQHPEILVSFDEANHQIIQRKHVNIGMAVALDRASVFISAGVLVGVGVSHSGFSVSSESDDPVSVSTVSGFPASDDKVLGAAGIEGICTGCP